MTKQFDNVPSGELLNVLGKPLRAVRTDWRPDPEKPEELQYPPDNAFEDLSLVGALRRLVLNIDMKAATFADMTMGRDCLDAFKKAEEDGGVVEMIDTQHKWLVDLIEKPGERGGIAMFGLNAPTLKDLVGQPAMPRGERRAQERKGRR